MYNSICNLEGILRKLTFLEKYQFVRRICRKIKLTFRNRGIPSRIFRVLNVKISILLENRGISKKFAKGE